MKSCAVVFIVLLTGALAIWGCMTRTVYVYENADGRRTYVQDGSPNRVEVSDFQTAADPLTYTAPWHGAPLERLTQAHRIEVALTSPADHGTMRSITTFDHRELATTQPAAVTIHRDAGTMTFTAQDAKSTTGTATLTIDPQYLKDLSALVGEPVPPDRGPELFRTNLTRLYARAIVEAGYKPTLENLLALAQHGISAQYAAGVRKAGYAFDIPQVIDLDRHGISVDYLKGLKDAGYSLDDKQIVELDRHGISVRYAREMREAGFSQINELIELDRHGISPAYVRDMSAAGFKKLPDIIDFDRHGIRAADVKKFQQAGYQLDKAQLIALDQHGVSADFASKLRQCGYQFSAKDLIELDRYGVSADYAKQLRDAGYDFTAADLCKLSQHGVSASFAAALHQSQKPNLSADAIIHLSDRGVDAVTVKELRGL